MADIVTRRELEDAKIDARDLGKAANEKVIVSPRYGGDFKSIPLIAEMGSQEIINLQNAINIAAAAGAGENGWTAQLIVDASGKTQQQINDRAVDLTLLLIPNDSSSTAKALNSSVIRQAIITAKAANKKIKSDLIGTIHVDGDFDFKGILNIEFLSDILNSTGSVIIGGESNLANRFNVRFANITNGTGVLTGPIPEIPTFIVEGVKTGDIYIGNTNKIEIRASTGARTSSNGYFNLYPAGNRCLSVKNQPGANWNNEFYVIGGRLTRIEVEGSGYNHNHIKFIRNTFEKIAGTPIEISLKKCHHVKVLDARFEGVDATCSIFMDEETTSCDIIGDWSGAGNSAKGEVYPRGDFGAFGFVVNDLGRGNFVGTDKMQRFEKHSVIEINSSFPVLATASESTTNNSRLGQGSPLWPAKTYVKPNLNGLEFPANRMIGFTDFLAVENGDSFSYNVDVDHANLRVIAYCYDANMRLLEDTDGGDNLLAQPSFTYSLSSKAYNVGPVTAAYLNSIACSVISPLVKFVRIGIWASVATVNRHIGINLHTQKNTKNKRKSLAELKQKSMALSGKPSMGFAPIDTVLVDTLSGGTNTCTFALDTYLIEAASTSSTTIKPSVTTGLGVGMVVGIQLDNGQTQWTTIKAVSSGVVTIDPLAGNTSNGARVVFNSWKSSVKYATKEYDPPEIPANSTHTTTVTVDGAVFIDTPSVSFNRFNAGISISAQVSAASTVTVIFRNTTATPIDLGAGLITVKLT